MKRILLAAAVFALALGLVTTTTPALAGGGNDRGDNNHGSNNGPRDPRTRDGKPKVSVHVTENDRKHDWNREHGSQRGYSQIVNEYHMDSGAYPWAASVCDVNFTGTFRDRQDYVLRANGVLYFKYTGTGQAEGRDSQGRRVNLNLTNYEIDLILATTPPDLGPYNGVLADWVNDHLDIVIDVKSEWKMTIGGSSTSVYLLNDWVFHATHTGIKLHQATFEVRSCPPFLDSPTISHDGRDRDGYDRQGYDRDGYDRNGCDRDGRDRQGYDRDGRDRQGYDRDGRDRQGYDRDGRDRNGRDRNGNDRSGNDRNGNSRDSDGRGR